MATIAPLFNSFLNPPKSAQLKNPAPPLSLSRPSISPARIPIQAFSLFNDNRQFPQPISKPGLPEDVLLVVNPSLAYANTLFFNSAYNVVEENEPEENLLNRFQREVMKAGVIQESKRNRRSVNLIVNVHFVQTLPTSLAKSLQLFAFKQGSLHIVTLSDDIQQDTLLSSWDETLNRRLLIILATSGLYPAFPSYGKTKSKNPYDEKRLLEQNRRIQKDNNAPPDFPNFVREGFAVQVLASDNYVKRDSGLVLWDIAVGDGDCPKDGQQVTFHYIGYNESGRRIDSTYLQGSPAKIRMGTNALVPGFEEGIRDMKPGGKRRIIIPPELGPPVGPSTFFSAKQFEVFDVELLSIQDCKRRTIGFYSDVVCNE